MEALSFLELIETVSDIEELKDRDISSDEDEAGSLFGQPMIKLTTGLATFVNDYVAKSTNKDHIQSCVFLLETAFSMLLCFKFFSKTEGAVSDILKIEDEQMFAVGLKVAFCALKKDIERVKTFFNSDDFRELNQDRQYEYLKKRLLFTELKKCVDSKKSIFSKEEQDTIETKAKFFLA